MTLRSRARILSIGVFLLLAFVYWACVRRYLPYDGDMMFRVTRSLVTAHSLRIEDPVLHLNEPYSFYGLAVSLLLVPLFIGGQLLFGDGRILITTFEPIVTALTVVALLSLLVELGVSHRRAFVVALIYAFGSLAWAYSGVLYSEPLVGLCMVSSVLFLRRYDRTAPSHPPTQAGEGKLAWLLAAGGTSALAVLTRWDSALLVVVPLTGYVAYELWKTREGDWRRRALAFAIFASPIAAVTVINLAYDIFRYGRPLASPYTGTFQFSTPLPVGVFGLLLSPGAGLLVYVPVVLLGAFGAASLFRRWPRVALLIAGLLVVRLAFYGQWFGWDGGITWGPRFLVPIVPLLFVPIAFLPRQRLMAIVLVALAALSVGVELLNQLVPYGQYYTSVADALDASARNSCPSCPLWQVVQLTTSRLDYDWTYIPLHGQMMMLLHGVIDPTWRRIGPAVVLLIAPLAIILLRLHRLAGRLDRQALEEAPAKAA